MTTSNPHSDLYLNDPQARVILIDPKVAVLIYGRRLGKSSEIIAHLSLKRIYDMPGASFLLLGKTYTQLLSRTLAATKAGWAKRGFIEDVHYVVGKKPPKTWPRPQHLPSSWEHSIATVTGTVFPLGSQDREGLVNSLTCHGLYADEAKFLNPQRFREDALPVVSAPRSQFPQSPHNRSIILCTSMPSLPEGQWLLDYEKLVDRQQINLILKAAVKAELLKEKYAKATGEGTKATIASEIRYFEQLLHELRMGANGSGCTYYDEASTLSNVRVLGLDYIAQQRDVLKDNFNTEILNVRPTKTNEPFYAKLTDRHFVSLICYAEIDRLGFGGDKAFTCRCDEYNRQAPLIVGMDFGANINCMVTAQRDEPLHRFNVLKEHFVKSPQIQEEVVNAWCAYYAPHACREVMFHYDNSGNNATGFTRNTRAEQVKKIMEAHGWKVTLCTKGGANRAHSLKHLAINIALAEKTPGLYKIRINEPGCEALRESMTYAKSKDGRKGEIVKNKSLEHSKSVPQEYATHLSDAFDVMFCGEFSDRFDAQDALYRLYAALV
ncbi:MAG: hypothetical protein LBL94_05310 [Prevotellaceae bacterium]|jgi:hypothetical protein|nr:hypothetical protein [Prevotellaceae bacterium]